MIGWDFNHRKKLSERNTKIRTILCAISLSRQGSLLVLWLMALRRMCFGRAPNTWELPVVFVTALNMALTSAARAFAKSDAGGGKCKHHIQR